MGEDRTPRPGRIYKHCKGMPCQVIAVAEHTETGEKMVVYQKLYDDFSVYVMPYDMFIGEADQEQEVEMAGDEQQSDMQGCNPDLLAFLEADTYEEKRNILISIRKRLDDRLINDIAASLDVTVDDGNLDIRYKSLMNCLDTMAKFECNRLR